MYKRFTFTDLQSIRNNFFEHFERIAKKEKYVHIKDFCKNIFKQGPSTYYFYRGEAQFICHHRETEYSFIDPIDSIEVIVTKDQIQQFAQLFKVYQTKQGKKKSTQTIEQILMQLFSAGKFNTINGKPYIVYDIETDGDVFDVTQQKFIMAYAAQPTKNNKMDYEYVDMTNLKGFVKKLLDFDGYIVGFNNISFDNPIIVHNIGGDQEMTDILNKKSLDIFTFLYHNTGKKIGLNRISSALVGVTKTLTSGLEGSTLYKQYCKTGDETLLNTFKAYCKNDVKMTILTLLYLIYYQKLHIENQEIAFTIDDLIQKGMTPMGKEIKIEKKENHNQSIFELN